MQDTAIVRASDFTQDTAAKAFIAGGGVLASTLTDWFCHASQSTALACRVAGGISELLKILLGMMALDLVTGVLASRAEGKRIESKRLSIGVKRKTIMLAAVAAAVMLDAVFRTHGFPTGGVLYKWTASWFIAVEALSLYENATRMGVPMPTFLKTVIEWLLQRAEKVGNIIEIIPKDQPEDKV